MNALTLKTYCKVKGTIQSKLAHASGISRQAISSWIKKAEDTPIVNVYSKNQNHLATVLGVPAHELSQDLPVISDRALRKELDVLLLWDHLFPDLESFVRSLIKGQAVALARLVQVYGLYQSEKVAGIQVWKKFPQYKNHLHPAIREKAELVWNTRQNPA